MYSTITIRWNIKSAPASPDRSRVGPALNVFSLLAWSSAAIIFVVKERWGLARVISPRFWDKRHVPAGILKTRQDTGSIKKGLNLYFWTIVKPFAFKSTYPCPCFSWPRLVQTFKGIYSPAKTKVRSRLYKSTGIAVVLWRQWRLSFHWAVIWYLG